MAFAYSPCGEEREGYDVFATQEECMHTCMHQGTKLQLVWKYSADNQISMHNRFAIYLLSEGY